MEEQRRIYSAYLAMRTSDRRSSKDPVALLQFYDQTAGSSHMTDAFVAFTREDVVEEFDTNSELVRWLLQQMSTYEPTKQCIVGLVFDKITILSDVLKCN